jgi:hypothetical protein
MRPAEGVSVFQLAANMGTSVEMDAGGVLRQEADARPEDGNRGDEEQKQDEDVSVALGSA